MQKSQENEEAEEVQKWVQKKGHPPEKLGSIRSSGGSWAAPLARLEQETIITVVAPAEALVRNPSTAFREESGIKAAYQPGPKTFYCDLIPLMHG